MVFLMVRSPAETFIPVRITTDRVGSLVKSQGIIEKSPKANMILSNLVIFLVPFFTVRSVIKSDNIPTAPVFHVPAPPPFWTCPKKREELLLSRVSRKKDGVWFSL